MPTPMNDREMILHDLDLAMKEKNAYNTDKFLSRENLIAVELQMQVLRQRLAALPN